MSRVFISHSSEDKYFVNLLAALLEFHHIETWCGTTDSQPGIKLSNEIENAIDNSDALLVVSSKISQNSEGIIKELSFFQAKKPKGQIIPLLIDSMNLDETFPGFKNYQCIDFTQCMLTGFETLLSVFNKEFLPHSEHRGGEDRRDHSGRRIIKERRIAPIIQRMRIGFWKNYASFSGAGKFDELRLGVKERFQVIEYLNSPANEFIYFDNDGHQCDSFAVLENSIFIVWEDFRKQDEFIKAIYVIEAITEEIYKRYDVKSVIPRRDSVRRIKSRRSESEFDSHD